jgi:hypothetical protein
MKFVDSYSKTDFQPSIEEQAFNKNGNACSPKDKVFAKFTETTLNNGVKQLKYLIATYNNSPYDPKGTDSHREATLEIKLKSVSKSVFDYYMLYLKTKNALYMTRAQRSYINV